MRIFMVALIALGLALLIAGLVGHLGPYEDRGRTSVRLAAYDMSLIERMLFVTVGAGIIAFAGASLKGR